MTFKQFAFNNVRRNSRQYLSYFLSCMFSVTVFFMYAVLMFHPDIVHQKYRQSVQTGIIAAEMIIFVFSFLFVLYSTGSFIKSRKKEYGLLTTLGISKSQLNWMLIIENTIIGLASIAAGILLGSLLSKIFMMFFSVMLNFQEPLRFYLSPKAIGLTAGAYFLMFELNSVAVVWTIRTNSVMELFRGAKSPKKAPRFSWLLSTLSLLLIGYSYYLAWTSDLFSISSRMIPILVLIIPGTYFFFTQLSIACVALLKHRKNVYFKGTNLLFLSDMIYKLKDNARLLFLVTILSAVAFTSSGVMFGFYKSVQAETEKFVPEDVTIASSGMQNRGHLQAATQTVEAQLKKKGIAFSAKQIQSLRGKLVHVQGEPVSPYEESGAQIISFSDYKLLAALQGNKVNSPDIASDVFWIESPMAISKKTMIPPLMTVRISGYQQTLHLKVIEDPITNGNYFAGNRVIVSDAVYRQFAKHALPSEDLQFYAMNIPNWVKYVDSTNSILASVQSDMVKTDSRAEFYMQLKDSFGYSLFFGIFISVLFFLAAGSILYFRLYQDMDKDLDHYRSLYRIGLTEKEMKGIVTKELSFLFFIPFLIAVVHAGFAFKALQNLLSSSVLVPTVLIVGGFLVIHAAYFFFIRNVYAGKLKKGMGGN